MPRSDAPPLIVGHDAALTFQAELQAIDRLLEIAHLDLAATAPRGG